MSSVKIVNCAFTKSSSTIQGDVTFEVTFSETEVRLDLAFIPTLYITPSEASTRSITIPAGITVAYLIGQRAELAYPQPPIRPSGNSAITLTASIQTAIDPLFKPAYRHNHAQDWEKSNTQGLDVRADVSLDLGSSSGVVKDQRFGA